MRMDGFSQGGGVTGHPTGNQFKHLAPDFSGSTGDGMSFGTLYLIPVPLGPNSPEQVLPPPVLEQVRQLERFVAENAKSARAFLKSAGVTRPLRDIPIAELNEHSTPEQVPPLLEPLLQGQDVGLVSEAGCPAVADPGAALVRLAQQRGVPVVPMGGRRTRSPVCRR